MRAFPAIVTTTALLLTAMPHATTARSASGQTRAVQSSLPSTPEQQLSQAINLVVTDDDTREAEQLLLNVIRARPLTTKPGEAARYYLGRYYHRNYYMLKQRDGLDRAVDRYKEIHLGIEGRRVAGKWYAEARFYKSIAYLELGKWKDAFEAVDHIVPTLDGEIAVDYLVWSLNRRNINGTFPSDALKKRYLELLKANGVTLNTRDGVDRKRYDAIRIALQALLEGWYRRSRG